MCVQRLVVQTAIGETIAIVSSVLYFGDQADFGEIGDAFVRARATAQIRQLLYERCRDDLVILGALFNLAIA